MTKKVNVNYVKEVIHELYNSLAERPEKKFSIIRYFRCIGTSLTKRSIKKNIPNISSIALSNIYIWSVLITGSAFR